MKEQEIAFIVFTSWDFREAPGGNWLSGGLEKTVQPLNDEDYKLCLIVRALTLDPPIVKPLGILIDATDVASRQRAVCLTPSF